MEREQTNTEKFKRLADAVATLFEGIDQNNEALLNVDQRRSFINTFAPFIHEFNFSLASLPENSKLRDDLNAALTTLKDGMISSHLTPQKINNTLQAFITECGKHADEADKTMGRYWLSGLAYQLVEKLASLCLWLLNKGEDMGVRMGVFNQLEDGKHRLDGWNPLNLSKNAASQNLDAFKTALNTKKP